MSEFAPPPPPQAPRSSSEAAQSIYDSVNQTVARVGTAVDNAYDGRHFADGELFRGKPGDAPTPKANKEGGGMLPDAKVTAGKEAGRLTIRKLTGA